MMWFISISVTTIRRSISNIFQDQRIIQKYGYPQWKESEAIIRKGFF